MEQTPSDSKAPSMIILTTLASIALIALSTEVIAAALGRLPTGPRESRETQTRAVSFGLAGAPARV